MTHFAATDSTPTAIMDRISLVLDAFEGPGRLTLGQATARTGLPSSTVHRLLERLVAMRWLHRDGRHYELGTRLMELGSLAVQQNSLHSAALPVLYELHRVTGRLVHLGILEGSDVVHLEKVGPRDVANAHGWVGGRHPAHLSPLGRALLAHAPESPGGAGGLDAAERDRIRNQGVAYLSTDRGCGIAVPIGAPGAVVAAISISGPVGQLKLDAATAAPVRIAASTIAQSLPGGSATVVPIMQRRNPLRRLPSAAPSLQYA